MIQLNDFGGFTPTGSRVDRPEIATLRNPGVHPVGEGVWNTLHLWEELGSYSWNSAEERNIQPRERTGEEPAALAVRTALQANYEPEITTDAPITVGLRRYSDGERWVVHLVSYDFDQTLDAFNPAGPFVVTVDVGEQKIATGRLYDFEAASIADLPVQQAGSKVVFTLPSLYAYSIVELLP